MRKNGGYVLYTSTRTSVGGAASSPAVLGPRTPLPGAADGSFFLARLAHCEMETYYGDRWPGRDDDPHFVKRVEMGGDAPGRWARKTTHAVFYGRCWLARAGILMLWQRGEGEMESLVAGVERKLRALPAREPAAA